MRKSTEIFIPIPKARNTQCKVVINSADMSGRIIESDFVLPVTDGIGTFKIILSNAHGQFTKSYRAGHIVKFYADNTDATTLQFWGRIDYVRDRISQSGQVLEIEGRHRSFLLTEYLICHSATGNLTSQVLKDIIDKLPSGFGFTYTNVGDDTATMDVEWNYKPFWDCVFELCQKGGFDCYVDHDLDFHYFEADSIANSTEAIVEGQNFLSSKDWGTNDYYEKTRVTVIGQNEDGLPIVYTAINPDETDIREVFIKDSSANTSTKVQNIAEAKLSEITNRTPQAVVMSFGIETLKPGENIWILIPRQQIHGQYKIVQIKHKFGMKVGGWRTECLVEQTEGGISQTIQNVNQKSDRSIQSDNINKLNYSYNLDFDSDSGTHSSTEITEGVLKTDGGASGTWISDNLALDENADSYELRVVGETLPGTNYYVSTDGGNTWQSVGALKTKYDFTPPGQNLKIKVELNAAATQIYSLVLLYS